MCREVDGRLRLCGPVASPLDHVTVGGRDKTALDLRREGVKQAMQGDSFLDGYGGAGVELHGGVIRLRWMTPLLFTTSFRALPLGRSLASRTATPTTAGACCRSVSV